jgi:outer membrane protein assembly factor BamA
MVAKIPQAILVGFSSSRWPGRVVATFFALIILIQTSTSARGADDVIIRKITCEKNNITKISVILRELPFREGDTVAGSDFGKIIAQSVENLLNTALFNFVTVDTAFIIDGKFRLANITYSFVERWYIWPAPILEISDRNFNVWYEKHDFTRLNYGAHLVWNNVTGRMENLDMMLRFGKNQQYSLLFDVPYVDRKKQFGAGIEGGFTRNREMGYVTENDKLIYGFNSNYLVKGWFAALHLLYRGSIHYSHMLDIGFQEFTFSDSLLKLNPEYFSGEGKRCSYPSVYYKFKADFRDAKYYPLTGWYADVEFSQSGFGSGGNTVDDGWIKTTSRIYRKFANRWYAGASVTARLSTVSDNSYFMNSALGYNRDFVRGYEYYVVDGTHFGVAKTTLKFALIPERNMKIGFIPTDKFSLVHYAAYLTWFGDAGYVVKNEFVNHNNQLPGTWLLGTGFGLDLVTYYDKVMRIEAAMNRKGEMGIYIHLIAGL